MSEWIDWIGEQKMASKRTWCDATLQKQICDGQNLSSELILIKEYLNKCM